MRKAHAFGGAIVALSLLLGGCEQEWSSVYRTVRLNNEDNGNQTLVTDAKQRVILNIKTTKDNIDSATGRIKPDRIICAEPSPDVAQAVSTALQAAIQVKPNATSSGSGSLGVSSAESVAQLGERLASIQLLRDKMYRACEAYANGAIGPTSYTLMLSRIDKTMTTMLSAELAAGEFGRNLATAGSSASTSGVDSGALDSARNIVLKASDKLSADLHASSPMSQTISDDGDALISDVNTLTQLELQAGLTKADAILAANSIGSIAGLTRQSSPEEVAAIHGRFMDDGVTEPLVDACITEMSQRSISDPSVQKEIRDAYKKKAKAKQAQSQLQLKYRQSGQGSGSLFKFEPFDLESRQDSAQLQSANDDISDADATIQAAFITSGSPFAAFCATHVLSNDGTGFIDTENRQKLDLRRLENHSPVDSCNDILTNADFKNIDPKAKFDGWSACVKAVTSAPLSGDANKQRPAAGGGEKSSTSSKPAPISLADDKGKTIADNATIQVPAGSSVSITVRGGTPDAKGTKFIAKWKGTDPGADAATIAISAAGLLTFTAGPKADPKADYVVTVADGADKQSVTLHFKIGAAGAAAGDQKPAPAAAALTLQATKGSDLATDTLTLTQGDKKSFTIAGGTGPYTAALETVPDGKPVDAKQVAVDVKDDQLTFTVDAKATPATYGLAVADSKGVKLVNPSKVTVAAK